MVLIKSCGRRRKRLPPMKPDVVEIHLKKMVIVPEMIGTIVGFHNGKVFTQVEVKSEMIGHYLGEFSISSKQQKRTNPMWLSKFHASSNQNAPWIQPLHPLPTTIPHKLYTCYSNFNSLSVSWNYLGRPVLEDGRDEWQCHSSNEMWKLCGDCEL